MAEIKHIGTPRHSGRYPWGSGNAPNQRGEGLLGYVEDLKKKGMSEVDIAKGRGLTTTELREQISIENNKIKASKAAMAFRLREKGYSYAAIGKRMGISDHTAKEYVEGSLKERLKKTEKIAEVLQNEVDKKKYIDVGSGVETHLGISDTRKKVALAMLEKKGYNLYVFPNEQLGTQKYTWMKVLARPEITKEEVSRNRANIKIPGYFSEDRGESFKEIKPTPVSIDGKRVYIRYAEEGGKNKDGVIELRRNVSDISLGVKNYAQVRVAVDGTHFMKGMAMYGDDIPKGYDIVYNSNKPKGTVKDKIFKPMENDPDYPFGSVVRPKFYIDKDGKEKQSVLNTVGSKEGSGEEGAWNNWDKNLSSQILSKQTPVLAKKQLGLAYNLRKEEYDEIMSLTNPAVKQALLTPFADQCDAAAVHLKAAALPGQRSQVILPINSLKEKEIYAPNFKDGENVVLIRHPHGGIFEIPEVIVNNKNPEAKRLIGIAEDAIGIHPTVAKKLSGADFDGDAVIVIPNPDKRIKTASAKKTLLEFDPKESYPYYDGMKVMDDKRQKGIEMGKISNLITDMTIKGANLDEVVRAVKHSMVVIDAPKHKLNYKQSYIDNGIAALKKRYQGKTTAGAATLISRAGAEKRVNERVEVRLKKGEPVTGEKLYKETGRMFFKRSFKKDPITGKKIYIPGEGKWLPKQTKTTKMAEEKDAFKLSSGSKMEDIYAEYANGLKDLARKARISFAQTKNLVYSHSASKIYAPEVASLKSKLRIAFRNKPLERQAQLLANKSVFNIKMANPHLDEDAIKKIKGQELTNARLRVGAKKEKITITDREWEAIQAGAVSHHTLLSILTNSDLDQLKQRAMPRYKTGISPARLARAKQMKLDGHTLSEIAAAIGVSVSTLESNVR